MEMILDYTATLQGVNEVHFLPYHALGKNKYRMLGRKYAFEPHPAVNESELLPYLEYARGKGLIPKTGG
jgi:pyruvate formate lyase activating enzyme